MTFRTSQKAHNYLVKLCNNIEDPLSNNELNKLIDKSQSHLKLANYYKSIPGEQSLLLFNYHNECINYYYSLYNERCKLIVN